MSTHIEAAGTALSKLTPAVAISVAAFALVGWLAYEGITLVTHVADSHGASLNQIAQALATGDAQSAEFRSEMREHWRRSERNHEQMLALLRAICGGLSEGRAACYGGTMAAAD